ncbi:hypothetical protein [Pyxidicoccus xibeiensis]|uniref:hypothetical protein n=1 Tax=Pyxidicoccus xibeiensis TaxID=2906759 RepID=UPI0020A7F1ED|nr:hypothetical protein [Pyxidicoccus xibeiensis]MCP3140137.1 hypothetical protein [Pyxidicoccus xibeiensis]
MSPPPMPLLLRGLLACSLVLAAAACGPVEIPGDAEACADVVCTAGTCSSNGGQPMCRCGTWEVSAGLPCEVGAFEEPDDIGGSPADATVLTPPMQPLRARINKGLRGDMKDKDLFTFTATERHGFAFRCGAGSLNDSRLRLLDSQGREASMQVTASSEGRMGYALVEAGTWYVEVSGAEHTSGEVATGSYTYQLIDLGADDHGDTPPRATVLQPSRSSFPVTHSAPQDRDVFSFRAFAGRSYTFRCQQSGSPFRELRLMAANGEVREAITNPGGPWVAVGLRAERQEDWYLELRADPIAGQPPAACWLEDLGFDEHSDTHAGATPVLPGVPVPTTLQWGGDVDVFSFTGEPGHVYSVRTEDPGSWQVMVVDAAGQAQRLDATNTLSFKPTSRGTYYLHVRGGTPWFHSFRLVLVDLGPDDHGDTSDTATPIVPGNVTFARFETPQDRDAVSFTTAPDGIYLATCEPACDMDFYYTGTLNFMSTGRAGQYLIDASQVMPITLFLRPRAGVDATRLLLERVATDDHGDTPASAGVLTLPAARSGRVQTAVDGDAFIVWLEAGRTYRLGQDLGALRLMVTGPDGSTVTPRGGLFTAHMSGTWVLMVFGASELEELPWSFTLQRE